VSASVTLDVSGPAVTTAYVERVETVATDGYSGNSGNDWGGHQVRHTVHDDGTGPHTTDTALLEREGHMGLTGMRERIAALGGSVRFDGQPGAGARVEVQVPITAGEAA